MTLTDEALVMLTTAPLLAAAPAAALSHTAARRMDPVVATWLLCALALSVAVVSGMLLCLLGVVGLAQVPGLAGLGHWSAEAMRTHTSIHPAVGLIAGAVATALLASTAAHLARVISYARRATATAASQAPAPGGLLIVQDAAAYAYAVPGRRGRIVVSRGMLARLDAQQRRVLLAHENAHLRHRHHLYVQAGRLAAAANPLMRPVSSAIDLAVERWADEAAAREVGDRTLTARALVTASRANGPKAPTGALAGSQTNVADRVRSLLGTPSPQRSVLAAAAMTMIACWACGLLVVDHIHDLMELSESL